MKKNIPILMYHNITDDKNDLSSVYYKDFHSQIKYLTKLKYKAFNLKDINDDSYNKKFIITFDDGYENVFKIAMNILNDFNQKGTCFIVANNIEKTNDWDEKLNKSFNLKLMNSSHINEWINNDFEIGSHSLDHLDLTILNKEEKENQIINSKEILNKKFNYNVQSFSYPYGKYDYDCVNILKNYYNFAVTTNKSLFNKKKHGLLEMPRVSIGRNTSMFKFFLKTLTIYENLK